MRDITKAKRTGTRPLPGLDLRAIFSEGFRGREDANDKWHVEDPENWSYHASSLVGCPRAAVLSRAGMATDGITLEAALTFEVGHCYHRLLENFCYAYEKVEPRFKVLAVEAGGKHPFLPLKARCDLLFSWEDEPILCDLKTEAPLSRGRRVDDQSKYGYPFPYRFEHQIQVAAQALVIEQLMRMPRTITQGRILYINKVTMACDQVPVAIDEAARLTVARALEKNFDNWEAYKATGALPPQLGAADEVWRCKARTPVDPMGLYCQARSSCFGLVSSTSSS
jgi:hypothetical protein